MKPAGVILTFIDWRKWKKWFFNVPLFLFQLLFMIVGTAYGKIKWEIKNPIFVDYVLVPISLFGIVAYVVGITDGLIGGAMVLSILSLICALLVVVLLAIFRGIPWRRVWRAAQVSHVRLVLEKWESFKNEEDTYAVANFGYPKMEIQPWRESWNKINYEYRDPMFEPSDEFIAAMIEYAAAQVGKRYDWLQLILGYPANFILWLWPPWWGKEKIRWFNLRSGAEVCSSGWLACLRWGEKDFRDGCAERVRELYQDDPNFSGEVIVPSRFFEIYDTAVLPPCMVELDENWRRE